MNKKDKSKGKSNILFGWGKKINTLKKDEDWKKYTQRVSTEENMPWWQAFVHLWSLVRISVFMLLFLFYKWRRRLYVCVCGCVDVFVGQLKAGKEKLPHSFITCVICPKGQHPNTHTHAHVLTHMLLQTSYRNIENFHTKLSAKTFHKSLRGLRIKINKFYKFGFSLWKTLTATTY